MKAIARKFFDRLMLVRGDVHRRDRAGALNRAWGHVFTNHLVGDYVEFGVYHGDSFIQSHKQYRQFREWLRQQTTSPEPWRRQLAVEFIGPVAHFHGLDTFAGMPENAEGERTFATGTFKSDIDAVRRRCAAEFTAEAGFSLHQGRFADTPDDWAAPEAKAAIINIDGDLYESCVDALAMSQRLMQVGTVLMMDDYNAFSADNAKGERRALREFIGKTGFTIEPWFSYMYSGQAFLIVSK